MTGILRRVGIDKRQDEVITIDVLHQCHKVLNLEWYRVNTLAAKRVIAEMGCWFICGFCTGLKGEEMLLIEYSGTAKSLKHLKDGCNGHFSFVILGRMKGNRLSGAKFEVPCIGTTEGTNLRPGKWIERLVSVRKVMKDETGRLFKR